MFESEEEEENDEDDNKEKPRNPFINYECDEGRISPVQVRNDKFKPANKSDVEVGDAFAKGHIVDENGAPVQPVKLLAPPENRKVVRSEPVKRKYNPEESVIKIDDFLAQRAKARKGPIGDVTLGRLAAPNGTPIMKVKQHLLSRRKVDVPFNIDKCFQTNECKPSNLVGPLMSGWVVKDDSDLVLIYPPRLKEMILYERLLSSHMLPSENLPEPMTVYPGLLSLELAHVALNMFTNTWQCPAKITDRRITFNGFSLGLYKIVGATDPNLFTLKLEAKCPLIQYYGVEDLIEILKLVRDCKVDSVKDTRPSKVKKYLA